MSTGERLAWLLLAAAILTSIVLIPPVVGAADNGDFSKLVGRFDMASPPDDEGRFVTLRWVFDERNRYIDTYYSSDLLIRWPLIRTVRDVLGSRAFDLRVAGVAHAAVFLLAWWLLLAPAAALGRGRFLLLPVTAVVFCDLMYSSYYNSFHMDTAAFLFLVLAAVLFVRAALRPSGAAAVAFLVAAVLLVVSKTQHSLLAIPLAGLIAWRGPRLWPGRGRTFASAGVVAVFAGAVFLFATTPHGYGRYSLFSTIFYGILPRSPDPAGDLRILGLDDTYRKYIGVRAYMPEAPLEDPAFQKEFDGHTNHLGLARLYVSRPGRAFGMLAGGMDYAGLQRVFELGNFTRESGAPERAHSRRFAVWSDLKRAVFGAHGVRYLAWVFALAAGLVVAVHRDDRFLPAALALAVGAGIEMLLGTLADPLEICRHLFAFNALLDVILVSLVAALVARLSLPRMQPGSTQSS